MGKWRDLEIKRMESYYSGSCPNPIHRLYLAAVVVALLRILPLHDAQQNGTMCPLHMDGLNFNLFRVSLFFWRFKCHPSTKSFTGSLPATLQRYNCGSV